MDRKYYLCILVLLLEWRCRLIWADTDVPSFEKLVIFLCLSKFDIDLDSSAPQFLQMNSQVSMVLDKWQYCKLGVND